MCLFEDSIIRAADKFCTFVKQNDVSAIAVYRQCAILFDYVLNELERAGKDFDDCPGILEPEGADALRNSIRKKLKEAFVLLAAEPDYLILPDEAMLTLDQANAEIQRIHRHFAAFVYFAGDYGGDFFDACKKAHEAQLLQTQARCEALARWKLQVLHNPSQGQLSRIHECLLQDQY